jgi:hypothetical protein
MLNYIKSYLLDKKVRWQISIPMLALIAFLLFMTLPSMTARSFRVSYTPRELSKSSVNNPRSNRESFLEQDKSKQKTLLLRLTRGGFEPKEITAPPGNYFLVVHNISELDSTEIILKQSSGARLLQKQMSKEHLKLRERVDLPPGQYILTEASHPNWICNITISN